MADHPLRKPMSLIVGIPACSREVAGHPNHATPSRYGEAVLGGAGAIPVLLPPVGDGLVHILDRIDGLLLSGSPSNVAPACYGVADDATPEMHDPPRDATTLPLIRAALARGLPVLAICRGIQELTWPSAAPCTRRCTRCRAASTIAPGWAFGVQWHPEWRCVENADSMALFRAFGEACRAYATVGRSAA